ncbi:MAG: ammonia-forming cytochrome c nitrite reductase subunit c552 [Rhodobacteraceae bacterium]|nr:ammonia-forming cytochrome c nitrite reductase subunit c552 [Paracoccaceae bacterium]
MLLPIALFALSGIASAQTYVGSEKCTECHAEAAAAWQGSHHQLAWTMPRSDTVIGDFDGASFSHDGSSTIFSQDNGEYRMTITERDGTTTDYPVHSVVGIEPLQQYLLETESGRLQSNDVVWNAEKKQWYTLYPDQDLPIGDGLHWTGPYKTWNARCAECHATGYQRNFGKQTRTYASTQAEIGVGCEACHGPASAHLDWAAGRAVASSAVDLNELGLTISLTSEAGAETQIQQCAGCHSRRESIGDGNPIPGTPFHDAFNLSVLRPGLYHNDGQVLDEVYVYGSFLQSKMYARGVTCTNCHEPHSAGFKIEGNGLCTQCHSEAGNSDFPTLIAANYDNPSHHFHAEGSAGAQCKNCHMPEKTYMGIDVRSDHSFRIPRPDLGAETSSPDTCTSCHEDQSQDWAAARIAQWYPDSDKRGDHYGQTFTKAQQYPEAARPDLIDLAADTAQAGIVRATALFLLQAQADDEMAEVTKGFLSDANPLVRASAAPLQRGAEEADRLSRLMPLMSDPVRSVRLGAVKEMLGIPPEIMSPSQRVLVNEAMGEWRASLLNKLDFPETHLVMGGMALTMRNFEAATRAFYEVVEMDPQRVDAWRILVRLTSAIDGPDAARLVLNQAMGYVPDDPVLKQLQLSLRP